MKYDVNNWTVRTEFAKAIGGEKEQSRAAEAFYVTVGVPVVDWMKVYLKWDEFSEQGVPEGDVIPLRIHNMYSGCVNFRLHKNLNFQLEYRYHKDQFKATPQYNELWFMTYVRF